MKHKTAELEGALLDEAVAIAEGYGDAIASYAGFSRWAAVNDWAPSRDWAVGGPIIECQQIDLLSPSIERGRTWHARSCNWWKKVFVRGDGDTPLIAAMRAYVTDKLGEWVELP